MSKPTTKFLIEFEKLENISSFKCLYIKDKLRTYGTYILNQKFDSIRISIFRDITKIWKKITRIKDIKNIYSAW